LDFSLKLDSLGPGGGANRGGSTAGAAKLVECVGSTAQSGEVSVRDSRQQLMDWGPGAANRKFALNTALSPEETLPGAQQAENLVCSERLYICWSREVTLFHATY
jgi:hypothetical protein